MIFGRAYPIRSAVFIGRQSFSAAGSASYTLTADAGAYTVSGQAAILTEANVYRLSADTGTYNVSGQSATTTSARRLIAAAGAYVVSGQDANLTEATVHVLTADTGTYTVSGQAASFSKALSTRPTATGAYVVTGLSANLTYFSASAPVLGGRQPTRRWVPTAEEIARDKKNRSNFPYKHQFPDDREKMIHQSATILARSGGHARARNLTPSQRTKIASNAAKARWR